MSYNATLQSFHNFAPQSLGQLFVYGDTKRTISFQFGSDFYYPQLTTVNLTSEYKDIDFPGLFIAIGGLIAVKHSVLNVLSWHSHKQYTIEPTVVHLENGGNAVSNLPVMPLVSALQFPQRYYNPGENFLQTVFDVEDARIHGLKNSQSRDELYMRVGGVFLNRLFPAFGKFK